MLGNKSSQKSAKRRFLYSYEYRDQKMGGKKARNNFSRNARMMRTKKCCEKNRSEKLRKNVFYMHTNIVTKKWGEKRAKQFFQKHTNSACKKCLEKIIAKKCEIVRAKNVRKKTSQKLRKNFFYIHTSIVTKKWWKKRAKQFF